MALATIGDIIVARKTAKQFGVITTSRWFIHEVDTEHVMIARGKKRIKLTYQELADNFDLLAQITKFQIIK